MNIQLTAGKVKTKDKKEIDLQLNFSQVEKKLHLYNLPPGAKSVSVYLVNGQCVLNQKLTISNTHEILLSGMPPGIYLATLYFSDRPPMTRKFLISN